jgi:hypothetical protein
MEILSFEVDVQHMKSFFKEELCSLYYTTLKWNKKVVGHKIEGIPQNKLGIKTIQMNPFKQEMVKVRDRNKSKGKL